MIIGIDASRATRQQRTGTEAYAYHLLDHLIRLTQSGPHRLRLYFNDPPAPDLFPQLPHVEFVTIPYPRLWTHWRLARELWQRPPDVFFTPAHVIPLTYFRPSVATIHDLGYHFFPEAHPRRQLAYLRWSTRHNGRRARRVLADSMATRNDLVQLYGINPAKIDVVYPGLPAGLAMVTDKERLTAVQAQYHIRAPYFLYIGTLQPRKNLVRLIEAYSLLADHSHQLVLAGQPGWLAQPILDAIQSLPTAVRNAVILTGFVDEQDKAALISGAKGLLYPSLYEGFGFPVLEAQACGTAVMCANTSSLPEVAGDAAFLVDPFDTPAMTAVMGHFMHDESLRRQLVERGLANVRRFSWAETARQALTSIEKAGGLSY
jgi:glycosyltransferase involved in cell wall biosynthesis